MAGHGSCRKLQDKSLLPPVRTFRLAIAAILCKRPFEFSRHRQTTSDKRNQEHIRGRGPALGAIARLAIQRWVRFERSARSRSYS
jgi:hypothetical protein